VLVAGGLTLAGLLAWRLSGVVVMAFGSVLFAVVLHAFADPFGRRLRLRPKLALSLVLAGIVLALAGALWVFGRAVEAQLASLIELIPRVWGTLDRRLGAGGLGPGLLQRLTDQLADLRWLAALGQRMAGQASASVAAILIVAFAGIYLAYNPGSYVEGALLLLRPRARARARQVLEAMHDALRQWLLAQFASMLLVGVTTGVGLALAHTPSAFALGLIAGLGQFVPVVGPMAAAVPGLLAAAGVGTETFFWTAVVYLAAAQFEANVVSPLALRQMAQLPMAITMFAVLAMGVLFGPLGVLLATPLAVVAYVAVKTLYVEPMNGAGRAGS